MMNLTEVQLRKVALGLSALLILQLLWVGSRLLFLSEPDAIVPAESSLSVDEFQSAAELGEFSLEGLSARPLFWQGRHPYIPPIEAEEQEEEIVIEEGSSEIDKVELLGTYGVGSESGVIVAYKGKKSRLRADETIAGWQFAMLSETGAMFESGDRIKQLQMAHAKSDLSKLPPKVDSVEAVAELDSKSEKAEKKKKSKAKDKLKKNKKNKKKQDKSSVDNNDNTGE